MLTYKNCNCKYTNTSKSTTANTKSKTQTTSAKNNGEKIGYTTLYVAEILTKLNLVINNISKTSSEVTDC